MTSHRYLPIADYAFLSDCHSTALVSKHGSIDWACLGRFDSGMGEMRGEPQHFMESKVMIWVARGNFVQHYGSTEADASLLRLPFVGFIHAKDPRMRLVEEATQLFQTLAGLGNDVGLFSEEYDVGTGELLGNFPQAFTHLGLIAAERRLAGGLAL